MFDSKKIPIGKIVLIVWLVFATGYFIYSEYTRIQVMIGQRAYNAGITMAVNQLIEQTKACQPIPITSADKKIEVIATSCLKTPANTAGTAQ